MDREHEQNHVLTQDVIQIKAETTETAATTVDGALKIAKDIRTIRLLIVVLLGYS